jgi:hypothetical protein
MSRQKGSVASSTAPSGSMNRRSSQFMGMSSTMPCHVQVANLGSRALLAASLRSRGVRPDGIYGSRVLGMTRQPSMMVAWPRSRCHCQEAL